MNLRIVRTAALALLALVPVVAAAQPAPAASIPFIVNGRPITIASRPFQVAVLDVQQGDTRYKQLHCGGAVVAPTIVVTAGHCTFDGLGTPSVSPTAPSDLRVLVNTANLTSGGQVVSVDSIVRRPDYNPAVDETINDIAILNLATPVTATPVSVIPAQSDFRMNLPQPAAEVSGWGCSVIDTSNCQILSDYPTQLRAADIAIHSNGFCSAVYAQYQITFDSVRSLCAGDLSPTSTAPGACFGDSGGPLTIPGVGGRSLLVGVVSWGVACGGTPTAFTRITTYRSWLQANGVPFTPQPFASTAGPALAPGGRYVGGDFDGDSHGDVLAYVPGTTADSIFRGNASRQLVPGPAATINGTYTPVHCDLNGDGKEDLVLYGRGTAPDSIVFGATDPTAFTPGPPLVVNGLYTPLAGDFNGDGHCDLLLYGPGTSPDHLLLGDGTGNFTQGALTPINGTYTPVVGDFNGDHRLDIYWYGVTASNLWTAKPGGGFTSSVAPTPGAGYIPVAGDFDGVGRTDIFWYGDNRTVPAGTSAPDAFWNATTTGFQRLYDVAISGTYAPVVVDIDGDGKSEIVWIGANGSTSIWRYAL